MATGQNPLVSVLIVNWNGRHHLAECLDSLASQRFRDFEVVLVDNGSRDGSVDFVRTGYPWVKLVPLAENTGFAEGSNVACAHASGDYLVTLNNDTLVDPDWLQALVTVAKSHPTVGMVGSRVCAHADPERLDSMGVRISPDGMSRGALRGKRFADLACPAVVPILLPSACAALYKRAMVAETKFFDSDFFAYCEDTDLGLRGRLAGWEAVLATAAVVRHKYSSTGGAFSPFKLYLVERNHYWVALKTFPSSWLFLLPWMTFWRYMQQLRVVLTRRGSGRDFMAGGSRFACLIALLRGQCGALLGVPRVLAQRRQVMAKARLSGSEFANLLRRYLLTFKELLDDAG